MSFLHPNLWRLSLDEIFMKVALRLAEKGKGLTSPNPVVGAVVVKNGKIVGKGYHRKAGDPHAEAIAIDEAGKEAEGSTLFVNLEPCIHWGKTPPCAFKIKEAKVKRVVIGTIDPNPLVNSKGIEFLSKSGIEIRVGVLEEEAKEINAPFLKSMREGIPFVSLKMAMTLDGKVATWNGDSKWISSEESRRYVHLLRFENDAIMVGVGTIIRDDPLLTIRYGKSKEIVRVILDSNLSIPERAKIFETLERGRIIIFTGRIRDNEKFERLRKKGVEVIPLETDDKIPLLEVLKYLNKIGVNSVLVEGGHTLSTSFLENSLVDRIYIFVSPKLTGGRNSPTFFEGDGSPSISDSIKLKRIKSFCIGDDTVIIGDVRCLQE